jgi:hypothetical protein
MSHRRLLAHVVAMRGAKKILVDLALVGAIERRSDHLRFFMVTADRHRNVSTSIPGERSAEKMSRSNVDQEINA